MKQSRKSLLGAVFLAICSSSPLFGETMLWCPPDPDIQRFQRFDLTLIPDGGLIRVGSRVFRNCRGPSNPTGPRVMLLRFNPDLLAGPNSRSLAGRIVVSDAAVGDEWIMLRLRGQIEVGERTIGGVVYREFDHESLSEDQRKYKSTFLYDPALNPEMSGLPSHSVDCDEGVKANGLANFCSVEVYYMDIRAIIELIGDGPELPPIQREKFPELAREIADALGVLDVTEKVNELPRRCGDFRKRSSDYTLVMSSSAEDRQSGIVCDR